MFNPQQQYTVTNESIPIEDFSKYAEEYVVRPPYQRKSVWTTKKQRQLLDSLFRRYYVPRIVIREVRLAGDRTVNEVVDGQQRINTVQRFFNNELALPHTLADISNELPDRLYRDLPVELRRFIDRLKYDADIIRGIDDARNPEHQRTASDIFWRLQQGETLTYMEIAHARLSSLTRNFVEKYADDIRFDFARYAPVDSNADKHPFFRIIGRPNNRMQHLALLTRMLMIEEDGGSVDMKDADVMAYIDKHQQPDGIGNYSFENTPVGKRVLDTLTSFYRAFKDDPMHTDGSPIQELRPEYFIISAYMLLRHLRKYYVVDTFVLKLFADFLRDFHVRWASKRSRCVDVLVFSDNRQQSKNEVEARLIVLRELFFEHVAQKGQEIKAKDLRRAFSEADRIRIYRRDNGLCQKCKAEGKQDLEARVPWTEYEADHVLPHSQGGWTDLENAQLLCRSHNRAKGASTGTAPRAQ